MKVIILSERIDVAKLAELTKMLQDPKYQMQMVCINDTRSRKELMSAGVKAFLEEVEPKNNKLLTIKEAQEEMKKGARICRIGWNKSSFIFLKDGIVRDDSYSAYGKLDDYWDSVQTEGKIWRIYKDT